MMRGVALSLLCLLFILVEVQCQSFPYVSFMGQTLASHSYVDLSLVGTSGSDSVQCHTDLSTCCSGGQGPHRGDWYFPNGTRLPFSGRDYEDRVAQRVDLRRRNNATSPTGLYRCDIPTIAVYDPTDISVRDTVYVGLYNASGGDLMISGGIIFDSDLQTLTCISTGGPATNVTWTGDSATVTEGTETVLDDPETANYTHTLNVTAAGEYMCTVTNNKPSNASANITIEVASAPTGVVAVQDGATSIRVSWTPPSPLGATTGYTISYSGGGSSDNVTVDGGSTNNYTLTGLTNGQTYTISIAGTPTGLSSAPVEAMAVGLVPSAPVLSSPPTATNTTITITGGVPSGSVVTGFLVEWQRDRSVGCSNKDEGNITVVGGRFNSYTLFGLEPGNRYSISVRASNAEGRGPLSNSVSATTSETAPSSLPTSITLSVATVSSVTVAWSDVPCLHRNGEITGYRVIAKTNGEIVGIANVSGGARQATISGLTPATRYTVSVAAVNSAGIGPYRGIKVDTLAALVALVESSSATSLTISWTLEESMTATAYNISYSSTNTQCFSDSNTISGIAGSVTMHTLTGLEEKTLYSITVTATLAGGVTAASRITATTLTSAPSAPPSSVRLRVESSTSITAQWGSVEPCVDRNGEIEGYSVRYGEEGSGEGDRREVMVSGNSSGGMTTISGLTKETVYTVEVAAQTSAGTGPYSEPLTITTPDNIYLSLNGRVIPNHGYLEINSIGSTDDTALLCHTNHPKRAGVTHSGGNWLSPDGTRVGPYESTHVPGFIRNRAPLLVRLLRTSGPVAEGLYQCRVADAAKVVQTLFVGLYNNAGGDIIIPGGVGLTVDSDLNGPSPQFTLTCISTGGPATTVTWTRDTATVTERTATVYNATTAEYTHTLTVAGRLPGLYICSVSNSKPSSTSESLTVKFASAPTDVVAVQDAATSIRVSWTPPSPLGATTGYTISYSGGGSSSVNETVIDGGSSNSHTLTGLQNRLTYTLSIAATSQHFFYSDATTVQLPLVPAPGEVSVAVSSIAATSISLSWSVASGQVDSSEVVWRETDRGTESSSGSLPGTSYTIDQFKSSATYTITVRATNPGGTTESTPITFSTAPDVCQVEENNDSNGSEMDCNAAAIAGSVVGAVAVTLAATAIVAVVIMMVLRSHMRSQATNTTSGAVGIPSATSEAIELSKFSEATNGDPDKFQTTSNEAYNAVRRAGGRVEGDYENPMTLFSLSSSYPPTTTAATASDSLYEAL